MIRHTATAPTTASAVVPLIKDQLGLSSTQIGLIISAFFWSYVPAQLLAGWLAERINAYRTMTLGLALWAVATAASGLAAGFVTLMALRILLGLGESALFPCSGKLLVQHVPPGRLGSANGWIGVGMALGPALGTFLGGLLMARTATTPPPPPLWFIIRRRELWGACLGQFL